MQKLAKNLSGYKVGRPIARGARSLICEVKRESDRKTFASKCVRLRTEDDERVLRHLENENNILKDLHGAPEVPSQIVRRVEFSKVRKFFRLKGACLVLERVSGPDLQRYCEYSLEDKIEIVDQVGEALGFIHERGYIHGDLKPDNILVDNDGQVKLIDFGFAAPIGTDVEGLKGTWGYIAPEQTGGVLGPQTDVYNLGAAMYWIFTGEKLPYLSANGDISSGAIGSQEIKPTPPHHLDQAIPKDLSDIIMRCCNADSSHRPTLKRLRNKLHDINLRLKLEV